MRVRADGSARRTAKSPRSTVRGTITWAMASQAYASPAAGSLPGKKLMLTPILYSRRSPNSRSAFTACDPLRLIGRKLSEPIRDIPCRSCRSGEPALIDPRVGAEQEPVGINVQIGLRPSLVNLPVAAGNRRLGMSSSPHR